MIRRTLFLLSALLLLVGAGCVTVGIAKAADPNPDCALVVPDHPLTMSGLATPYQLTAVDPAAGACHEAEPTQAAFVEAAILDPATGSLGIYRPLVIDQGTMPALMPVVPTLPQGAVVGIWFGSNGNSLTLTGAGKGWCVNGTDGSIFGQFAYCNAPNFFAAAFQAIGNHKLVIPPLGTATDGLPCPTVRDFMMVDQDQSDNVASTYRLVGSEVAQDTATSRAMTGSTQANGSDERLLARFIDPALGCKPFVAPDLTDPGSLVSGLVLNELSAAVNQAWPVALVPLNDPMVAVNGHWSVRKTNLYRAGVGQRPVPSGETPLRYCRFLGLVPQLRLTTDGVALTSSVSPMPGVNLLDFLKTRLAASKDLLGCAHLPRPRHVEDDD